MNSEISTLLVCELTSATNNAVATMGRVAQCMDTDGAGSDAYFELGRLESTGEHIKKLSRILSRMELEKRQRK